MQRSKVMMYNLTVFLMPLLQSMQRTILNSLDIQKYTVFQLENVVLLH